MATIKLQTALKLIRFNHDDPEVREIIQTAIDELDRLYRIETQWNDLRDMAAPDAGEWAALNRVASK